MKRAEAVEINTLVGTMIVSFKNHFTLSKYGIDTSLLSERILWCTNDLERLRTAISDYLIDHIED